MTNNKTCNVEIKVSPYKRKLKLPKGEGLGCVHPEVIYFPEGYLGYKYWLFYTPYPPDHAELPYLVRSNNGIDFTDKGVRNPLLNRGPQDSWDSHHIADVDVLVHNGRWYLYYAGARVRNGVKEVKIGVAYSENGLEWEKYGDNPILEPDPDLEWEKGTRDRRDVATPTVIYVNEAFYMYYSALGSDGKVRIGVAVSKDGVHFEKYKRNPVLEPEYEWEGDRVNHPDVILYGDLILLLYIAGTSEQRSLGLAYAKVDNPHDLKKVSEKPIMEPKEDLTSRMLSKIFNHMPFTLSMLRRLSRILTGNYTKISSPLWYHYSIYRSSLLSNPKRELVLLEEDKTLLYFSCYSSLTKLPSIGVVETKVKITS